MEPIVSILRAVPLFAGLSREILARLVGEMDEIEVEAGQTIVAPGAIAGALFVVVSGVVEVRREEGVQWGRVASLGPGGSFGEVALFTGDGPTVTIVALCLARLLRLDRDRLFGLVERHPAAMRGLARGLGQVIRTEHPVSIGGTPAQSFDAIIQACSAKEYRFLSFLALAEHPETAVVAALPGCGAAEEYLSALGRRYPALLARQEDGQWQIHPDLRDLVRRRVGQDLGPVAMAELHGDLARVHEQRGKPREALAHWLAGGWWQEAVHLFHRLKAGPEPISDQQLTEWLDRFPDERAIVTELAAERARLLLEAGHAESEIVLYRRALEAGPARSGALESFADGPADAYVASGEASRAPATPEDHHDDMMMIPAAPQEAEAVDDRAAGRTQEASGWARRARSVPVEKPEPVVSTRRRAVGVRGGGGIALALAAGLLVLLWPPRAVTGPAVPFLAVLSAGTVLWARGRPPEFVVALGMAAAWTVAHVAPPPVIFAGFATSTWFFILGVLGLAAALGRSGLIYRITLVAMQRFPPTFAGQMLALALSGIVATIFIPSIVGRLGVIGRVVVGLADAFRYPPRSSGSAALGLATLVGFCLSASMFLTGTASCLVAWRLLPEAVRVDVTWLSWLLWALPLEALTFSGALAWIIWRYRPADRGAVPPEVLRRVLRVQLQTLGPVSNQERVTGAVAAALVLAWLTQRWHGVDPAAVAVAGLCVLVAAGALDRGAIQAHLDWPLLLLLGVIFSLGDLATRVGVDTWLAGLARQALHGFHHPALALTALVLATMAVRLVLPWPTAVAILLLAMAPAAQPLGLHPWIVALVTLKAGNIFLFPLQSPDYLTLYYSTEERAFSHAQVRPFAWAYATIVLLAFLATVPYWWALGLVRVAPGVDQ
jgi:di/tricarboxylate transporter